jgi:hypothetical protein
MSQKIKGPQEGNAPDAEVRFGLFATGLRFWWRVTPEQKRVDAETGVILVQRMVRVRNRSNINPTNADKARALRITYDYWKHRRPPKYMAIEFRAGYPIFYCPGLIFTSQQLVRVGKFVRFGRHLSFVRQHALIFKTEEHASDIEPKLARFAERVPGAEYEGHLGKEPRQVKLYFQRRSDMATALGSFPKATRYRPSHWKVEKPLIVKLKPAHVRALLWLPVAGDFSRVPAGVAKSLSTLARRRIVRRTSRSEKKQRYALTSLGATVYSQLLSIKVDREILPLVRAAHTLPFL